MIHPLVLISTYSSAIPSTSMSPLPLLRVFAFFIFSPPFILASASPSCVSILSLLRPLSMQISVACLHNSRCKVIVENIMSRYKVKTNYAFKVDEAMINAFLEPEITNGLYRAKCSMINVHFSGNNKAIGHLYGPIFMFFDEILLRLELAIIPITNKLSTVLSSNSPEWPLSLSISKVDIGTVQQISEEFFNYVNHMKWISVGMPFIKCVSQVEYNISIPICTPGNYGDNSDLMLCTFMGAKAAIMTEYILPIWISTFKAFYDGNQNIWSTFQDMLKTVHLFYFSTMIGDTFIRNISPIT